MAGVVGFEPTVQGIKTRGYRCQNLLGFSKPLIIVLMFLIFCLCVMRKITKTVVKSVVKKYLFKIRRRIKNYS